MAGSRGRHGVPVNDRGFGRSSALLETIANADAGSPLAWLVSKPFRFDFFQAVRLISLAATERRASPGRVPVPEPPAQLPYEEHIRFRTHVGHAFPASAVSSFEMPTSRVAESDGAPVPEMTVSFLGLAGTGGVLPWHYTQLLIDQAKEKDFGLRDFLDLFNHRLIAHFYRAWEKCHFYVGYESSRRSGAKEPDRFTQMLFSLAGMGTAGLRARQAISDEIFLYFAGHFSRRRRPAEALQRIVGDVFRVPTEIRQFQGQWMYLRPADQTRLRPGGNNQLGVSALAGRRVWGIENKIRVRLGALSYENFQSFLPGGSRFVALAQVIRSFAGPMLDFDVQLVIAKDEVRRSQLKASGGVRLGLDAWVFSHAPTHDLEDAVFACEGMPSY